MTLLSIRRAAMIISCVRLIAALFALLTPLWIVVDAMFSLGRYAESWRRGDS